MAVHISSTGEWEKMIAGHAVVIADFFADWCGPCKMIAPTFESLATKFSKPGKIAFAKINCDTQGDIAARYSVRAMPTFKFFHYGTVTETLQGANPVGLAAAVDRAVKLAGPGGAPGAAFSGSGHKLGGNPVSAPPRNVGGRSLGGGGRGLRFSPANFFALLRAFLGLYFVSLFSLDPYKAAEGSAFNIHSKVDPKLRAVGGQPGARGASARPGAPGSAADKPRIQTLADL